MNLKIRTSNKEADNIFKKEYKRMDLKAFCNELTNDIKQAYESGVEIIEAEKFAAKFLYGQIQVAEALKTQDLNARMRKTGLKAIKASVYMAEATKTDKKPSDVLLNALVDRSGLVTTAQDEFDVTEVNRNELENYFSIFKEAHIYFRGVSKGRFE